MDLDEAFLYVGEFGWCQKRLTGFLTLLQIYVACQSMLIVLVGAVPEYLIDNEDISTSKEDYIKHLHDTNNFTSIVSEWHLIKHEAYKVNLASSLFFAGLLIGNVFFGPLSDKLGRRPVYLSGLFFDIVFGYFTALAPSYEVFAVSRFFVGVMNGGMALVSFVLTQEYVGKSYWALTGSLTNLIFAVGIAFYALLGFYIRNWRTLAFVANSPGIFFLLLSFVLPESPRWLYSRGYTAEAEAVLESMAAGNGVERPVVRLKSCPGTTANSAHSVFDLVKYGVLRWRTILLMYIWYVCSLVYYGLTLNAGELKGNLYLNVALYGLVEVPAFPLCLYFIEKSWSGRRRATAGFLVFAGFACIFTIFVPETNGDFINPTVLALFGKLSVSAAFNVVYIYTSELYPTVVRSTLRNQNSTCDPSRIDRFFLPAFLMGHSQGGEIKRSMMDCCPVTFSEEEFRNAGLGVCAMACRFGGILSPFIPAMKSFNPSMPFVAFGISGISAGVLSLLLPETRNKPIAETIEDLQSPAYQLLSRGNEVLAST